SDIMNKIILFLIILANILSFSDRKLYAAEKFELKTSESTLSIYQNGNLKITHKNGKNLQINTSINNLWKIVLKNKITGTKHTFSPKGNFTIDKINKTIRIVVNSFSIDNKTLPVNAEFTISVKDDAFCFSGSLESNSDDWVLKELDYPNLT